MLKDNTAKQARLSGRAAWQGCCLGALLVVLATCGAAGAPPKQVLLLHSFGREFAPFNSFSEGFRTELGQQLEDTVEFHDVPLESARLEGDASEGPLVNYLNALFARQRLDLVVTVGGPAARFAQKYRARLFPTTPMLLAAVDERLLPTVALTTNDTVVAVTNDLVRLMDSMLQVLPETTNVVVVIGNSPLEKFWLGETRRQFQPFTNRVSFAYLNGLSFAEVLKRTAALPPRSEIYYALMAVDAEGVPYVEERALRELHAVANAPIFGLHSSQIGLGIVGGPVMAIEELSRNAAKAAARVLHGEPPGSIVTPTQRAGRPLYDWRELRRWHISEARLPMGSAVLFRQPTAWEHYKWQIIGVLALCVLEAVLIVLLLLNLVKRRRAERALRESEERLRLATAAADIGVWAWDIYDNRIWVSANWSRIFRIPPEANIGFETVFERVHPDDREVVELAVKRAIEQKEDYVAEYRIALPDGTQRWIAARGRLHAGGNAKHDRLVGVSVDITDRKRAIESVRRLQQQNELIVTSAAEGIIGLDLQGNHTFVNPAAARMLGYTPEELLRRHGHSTWHHTRADGSPYPYEECLICGAFRDGQVRRESDEVFWRKDGTSFPAAYTSTPIYQQGQVVGAVVTFQDVTERKAAERALWQSEERLRLVLEANSEGVWDWNIPSGKAFFSRQYSAMLGYEPEEFAKDYDAWKALVHPDDFERVNAAHAAHIQRGEEFLVEFRMRKKSGDWCWIRSRGTVVQRDADGRAIRMVGTHLNITERKQAEAALHESQTTLNAIIESTDDLIWSVDPVSFGLMTFNRGLRDYFLQGRGIRIEPGMRPEDLFPPGEYVQRWRDFYQRALQEGPFTVEYVVYTQDRTLQLSFNVLKQDGKVFGVSAFGKDITERKRAEMEAQQQRQELAHVARVSVMGELAASVAHELNQPLGAILSNAEAAELFLQQDPPALDELSAILADIRKDDERAGEVIRRMRTLLRKRELEHEPLEINLLVEDVFRLVSADAALRKTAIGAELSPYLPLIEGDRVHLQQVLLNLIMNAMEAMAKQPPERRRLTVRTRCGSDGEVEVSVTDSGPGIEPANLPRLFEPFFTTKQSGIGMGLAIARKIVEAHQGRIWAENRPGGGAIFRVSLPGASGRKK